ncbi:hypothetical protein [Paenarthrobacter sp. C1]|uniref:hypothetical protein n=1 Tax=Paenarthrobacter sp. C1 TaxID=3400220 RepID=UPI003BF5D628
MTVLLFPARPASDQPAVQLVPVPTPTPTAQTAPVVQLAPVRVLPGESTADRVALAALIAATGPAAAGYLIDTGIPAVQLLANALAAAALTVHVAARCSRRFASSRPATA